MDITTQSHLFTQLTNQSNLSLVRLEPFFKKLKQKNPQTHFYKPSLNDCDTVTAQTVDKIQTVTDKDTEKFTAS